MMVGRLVATSSFHFWDLPDASDAIPTSAWVGLWNMRDLGRILLSSGVSAHIYQSVISMLSTALRNSLWQESRLVFTTAQNEIIGNVNNLVSQLSV